MSCAMRTTRRVIIEMGTLYHATKPNGSGDEAMAMVSLKRVYDVEIGEEQIRVCYGVGG